MLESFILEKGKRDDQKTADGNDLVFSGRLFQFMK